MSINRKQWLNEQKILPGSFTYFKVLGLEDDVFNDLMEVVYENQVIDLNISDWYVYVTHVDKNGDKYINKIWSW